MEGRQEEAEEEEERVLDFHMYRKRNGKWKVGERGRRRGIKISIKFSHRRTEGRGGRERISVGFS